MKRPSVALVFLATAAFLLPISGGHVPMEISSLEAGLLPAVLATLWSFDAPSLAHTLLGLLVVGALIASFASNRVLQVPSARLAAPLLGFFALLAFSVVLSQFKAPSLASLAEWLAYGCAFFAVVSSAGRGAGPRMLLIALFAGCVVAALRAYLGDFVDDPTGRVFGGWQHPNALAGMLLVGLLIGCGLALTAKGMEAVAFGAGLAIIIIAIVLSQSKGGYLASLAGLLALAVILLSSRRPLLIGLLAFVVLDVALYLIGTSGLVLLTALVATLVGTLWMLSVVLGARVTNIALPFAVAALAIAAIVLRPVPSAIGAPAPVALARVAAPAATGDQSVRYRLNLWRSSVALVKMNPAGFGLNTFQFHGARPGLVGAGTVYAHQSFLQLAVEASPFAPIFLFGFLILIFREARLSMSAAPMENKLPKAGVLASLVGATAHCMTESNLYIMGYGLAFFMLAGIALQLSYDGSAPELMPREARWLMGVTAMAIASLLIYFGWIGGLKARINGDLMAGEGEGAARGSAQLLSMAPNDGEAWFIASGEAVSGGRGQPPIDRIKQLQRAVALRPTPRNSRALARQLHAAGRSAEALSALNQAVFWDPNNWDALHQEMEIQRAMGDLDSATTTARQLIATEASSAFAVRALPEMIPLQTYMARAFLAEHTKGIDQRAQLLQEAMDGYYSFAIFTVTNVNMGLISPQTGIVRATEGEALARKLAALYRNLGRDKEAERAAFLSEEFRKLAELLSK